MANTHPAARRAMRGWSQAELARRAGISRAAVSAIETGAVVPSVRVALALAKEFGCTVEELFDDGRSMASLYRWAVAPRDGCAGYWEVPESGVVLRYPAEAVSLNPFAPDVFLSGGGGGRRHSSPVPTLTLACCDPAARFFAAEYERLSGVRMIVLPRNGQDALRLLREGAVHLGGIHAASAEDPEANLRRVRTTLGEGWILLRAVDWQSGIVLSGGAGKRSVSSAARTARRWAMREKGAAARDCLDQLLAGRKPAGRVVRGHREVADAVQAGWADAGITLELCAYEGGLGFVPLRTEGLDLVFTEQLMDDPRLQKLVALLQGRAYRRAEGSIRGYSTVRAGSLVHS